MYKEFTLVSINTIAADKRIDLLFNFDVDTSSIQGDSIILSEKDNDNHIPFSINAKNDRVSLVLKEWPQPNIVYNIILNTNFKNIVGQTLRSSIRRKITFKSEVTSKVAITEPHNFEVVQDIVFKVVETLTQDKIVNDKDELVDNKPINQYYLEIATENVFYNVLYKLNITNDSSVTYDFSKMAP